MQKKRQLSEHGKKWQREWRKNKFENDINFVIAKRLRDRLYAAIKAQDGRKSTSAVSLLGCEIMSSRNLFLFSFRME